LTIQVLYSCARCGLKKIPLDVPARESPAEDVLVWMNHTVALVGHDHRRLSPSCEAKKIDALLIPMTGTDRVGGPTR
jgi:hypothetical protein